ncbi:MAG: hypothetical protein JW955_21190 [Sedimentisphaerales bacterium]|nr:hypothetical protein [Sedimentisphaerales bacterium]
MKCVVKMGLLALSCLVSLVSGGCLTCALWDSIDPDERVWVPSSEVTETELAGKGVEYEKEGDPVVGYNVEKSDLRKFGDYAALTALTPITVVVDAAVICAVVGGYLFLLSYCDWCCP